MALPFEYNMCWVVMSILSGNAFGVYNHLHFFFLFRTYILFRSNTIFLLSVLNLTQWQNHAMKQVSNYTDNQKCINALFYWKNYYKCWV